MASNGNLLSEDCKHLSVCYSPNVINGQLEIEVSHINFDFLIC